MTFVVTDDDEVEDFDENSGDDDNDDDVNVDDICVLEARLGLTFTWWACYGLCLLT